MPHPTPDAPSKADRPALAAGATLAVALCVAAATWGLMGPQQESTPAIDPRLVDDEYFSYVVRAPDVDRGVEVVIAALALVAAGRVIAGLVHSGPRRTRARALRSVAAALAVTTGLAVGVGARIVTAGTVGANIGAGLVIRGGAPLAVGLLVLAMCLAVRR